MRAYLFSSHPKTSTFDVLVSNALPMPKDYDANTFVIGGGRVPVNGVSRTTCRHTRTTEDTIDINK